MRALAFVDGDALRVQSANERDVTVSWPELAGPARRAARQHRAARRRAGGHRRRRSSQLRPPAAAHAHRQPRRGRTPGRGGAGHLRRVRPAPPRRPRPDRRCRSATGGGCSTRWSTPARRGAPSPVHDDGPALLDAADERRASRAWSPSGSTPPTSPASATRTWLKVKVRRRQEMVVGGWLPGEGTRAGRIGALLVGVPRPRRRRRAAALRGPGRHRLHRGRAARGWPRCSRRWPPTSARSTRRRPAPTSPAAPPGCGPSWWPSWPTASGPATTASATRATSACAPTRPPRDVTPRRSSRDGSGRGWSATGVAEAARAALGGSAARRRVPTPPRPRPGPRAGRCGRRGATSNGSVGVEVHEQHLELVAVARSR